MSPKVLKIEYFRRKAGMIQYIEVNEGYKMKMYVCDTAKFLHRKPSTNKFPVK